MYETQASQMSWFRRLFRREAPAPSAGPSRGYRKLVVVLDGTMSSSVPGCETKAGLAAQLIREAAEDDLVVYYEEGLQWSDWGDALKVMTGDGINGQIRRAYGWLASQYQKGDRIYFIGYSQAAAKRGAGFAIQALEHPPIMLQRILRR